jgi:hypothetical protein
MDFMSHHIDPKTYVLPERTATAPEPIDKAYLMPGKSKLAIHATLEEAAAQGLRKGRPLNPVGQTSALLTPTRYQKLVSQAAKRDFISSTGLSLVDYSSTSENSDYEVDLTTTMTTPTTPQRSTRGVLGTSKEKPLSDDDDDDDEHTKTTKTTTNQLSIQDIFPTLATSKKKPLNGDDDDCKGGDHVDELTKSTTKTKTKTQLSIQDMIKQSSCGKEDDEIEQSSYGKQEADDDELLAENEAYQKRLNIEADLKRAERDASETMADILHLVGDALDLDEFIIAGSFPASLLARYLPDPFEIPVGDIDLYHGSCGQPND